ncbi:MAG: hypothetical protein V4691_07300 [Pseudomonadota bacterium]
MSIDLKGINFTILANRLDDAIKTRGNSGRELSWWDIRCAKNAAFRQYGKELKSLTTVQKNYISAKISNSFWRADKDHSGVIEAAKAENFYDIYIRVSDMKA